MSTTQTTSNGISGTVSSSSGNPPSGLTDVLASNASSPSSVSAIDHPNPYRAPLAVLEEMRGGEVGRVLVHGPWPRVPLPAKGQPRLPFRQVDRRVVDERFVSQPYPYRPPQRVPARPMRQWSRLPQYRQIPIEQALIVRHDVVQISPEDFVHMGFPDAGVAHDVLYQGPGHLDLTRYPRYSAFRRDFEQPIINLSGRSSAR